MLAGTEKWPHTSMHLPIKKVLTSWNELWYTWQGDGCYSTSVPRIGGSVKVLPVTSCCLDRPQKSWVQRYSLGDKPAGCSIYPSTTSLLSTDLEIKIESQMHCLGAGTCALTRGVKTCNQYSLVQTWSTTNICCKCRMLTWYIPRVTVKICKQQQELASD